MHTTCSRTTFLTESRAERRSIAHHRELQCRHTSDATLISHWGPKKKEDFGLDRTHLPTSNVVRFREHATCGRQLPKRGRTHAACHVSETRSFVTLIFRSLFLFVKVRFLRRRYSCPAMHGAASPNWHLSFRSSYKLNRSTRVLSPPCNIFYFPRSRVVVK